MTTPPAAHATQMTREVEVASDGEFELGLDDVELISAYLDGNLAAYGELARRHQIPLFRLLLGLLADEDRAELACEEVFVVANQRLPELEDHTRFYHWLLGIAREVSEGFARAQQLDTRPPGSDPREHLKREVHTVLQALEPGHRLALVLVELREADNGEVAAALGCNLDSVPGIVAEARAAFVDALSAREDQTRPDVSIVLDAADAEQGHLAQGTVIAERYRIESLLGAGGMGAVYRAASLVSGDEVALKTLLPDLKADATALRRFEREAEAIARLDHRSFVKILDHGEADALRYLVMEYLPGRALADLVYDERLLDPQRALTLVRELLEGLEHAHTHGVVHRDLKPDNIMLVADPGAADGTEQPKILDLGLAKFVDDERGELGVDLTRLTRAGMVFGTPAYMAPEQALGKEVDARADLYAISVVLFELLTGQLPFDAQNPSALLVKHVSQPVPRLASVAGHLGGHTGLQALVDAGLAKQPDARIPSAQTYVDRIDALLRAPLPTLAEVYGEGTRELVEVSGPKTSLLSEAQQLSAEHSEAVLGKQDGAQPSSRLGWLWLVVIVGLICGAVALFWN